MKPSKKVVRGSSRGWRKSTTGGLSVDQMGITSGRARRCSVGYEYCYQYGGYTLSLIGYWMRVSGKEESKNGLLHRR